MRGQTLSFSCFQSHHVNIRARSPALSRLNYHGPILIVIKGKLITVRAILAIRGKQQGNFVNERGVRWQ
jgi:hypothetical protein